MRKKKDDNLSGFGLIGTIEKRKKIRKDPIYTEARYTNTYV